MEFKEAYDHLVRGEKVKRKRWEDKTIYLETNGDGDVKCYRQECAVFNYDLTVLDYEWVVIGKEEIVSFAEAIPLLLKGKKIKLDEWPHDCFIEVDESKKCLIKRGTCEYDFVPTFECLAADDWEVVEEDLTNEKLLQRNV